MFRNRSIGTKILIPVIGSTIIFAVLLYFLGDSIVNNVPFFNKGKKSLALTSSLFIVSDGIDLPIFE